MKLGDVALTAYQVFHALLTLLWVKTGVASAFWIQGNGVSENVSTLSKVQNQRDQKGWEYTLRSVFPARCSGPGLKPSTQQRQEAGSELALHATWTSAVRDFSLVVKAFSKCLCQRLLLYQECGWSRFLSRSLPWLMNRDQTLDVQQPLLLSPRVIY